MKYYWKWQRSWDWTSELSLQSPSLYQLSWQIGTNEKILSVRKSRSIPFEVIMQNSTASNGCLAAFNRIVRYLSFSHSIPLNPGASPVKNYGKDFFSTLESSNQISHVTNFSFSGGTVPVMSQIKIWFIIGSGPPLPCILWRERESLHSTIRVLNDWGMATKK